MSLVSRAWRSGIDTPQAGWQSQVALELAISKNHSMVYACSFNNAVDVLTLTRRFLHKAQLGLGFPVLGMIGLHNWSSKLMKGQSNFVDCPRTDKSSKAAACQGR